MISYLMTPPVKEFAEKVGAMDVPKDGRRVHDHPIPRMGGLAIFLGFVISLPLFVNMSTQVMGLLVGAVIIAMMGAVDDIVSLSPWAKLAAQLLAAIVAKRSGCVQRHIQSYRLFRRDYHLHRPFVHPSDPHRTVGCTNAMNLIDGLMVGGGRGCHSSTSTLTASLLVADPVVSVILVALTGSVAFTPYNMNPAKIFMGMWAPSCWASRWLPPPSLGLFKLDGVFTFFVPMLSLACASHRHRLCLLPAYLPRSEPLPCGQGRLSPPAPGHGPESAAGSGSRPFDIPSHGRVRKNPRRRHIPAAIYLPVAIVAIDFYLALRVSQEPQSLPENTPALKADESSKE
ncbi:MAG: MraY family glycosyltransferase [Oscillospiraceae bacterium]